MKGQDNPEPKTKNQAVASVVTATSYWGLWSAALIKLLDPCRALSPFEVILQ